MPMTYCTGSLLDTNCQYICHQVNCQGKMNSGVAKAIREKWPIVFEKYDEWHRKFDAWAHTTSVTKSRIDESKKIAMLGRVLSVPVNENQFVLNFASQFEYGYDGKRYTSYDAFWMCLGAIRSTVPKGSSIAFPYGIGCVRGGANWEVIKTMIKEVLAEDYDVYIYKLEETK